MRRFLNFFAVFSLALTLAAARAQTPADEVRVSVILNPDGSRTTYETDPANHKATATTTDTDGTLREKIRYDLDQNGRFLRSEVFGPRGQFRFLAKYRYDGNNHLAEETHFAKDETLVGRLVFHYDASGRQVGYTAYDGAGKLLGQTTPVSTTTPAKRR